MPKNTKVSRCVEKVKKQGGDVNPYAVCQASTGENYMTGKKIKDENKGLDDFPPENAKPRANQHKPNRYMYGHASHGSKTKLDTRKNSKPLSIPKDSKKSLPQGPKQGASTRDPKSPTYKEKPESKYDQRPAKTGDKPDPNKGKAMAAPVKPQKKTQIARPYSAHTKPAAPRPNAHEEVQYDKSLADGTKAQPIPGTINNRQAAAAPKPNAAAQYYQQQDTRNKQGAPARSRVSMFTGGGEQQVSQDDSGKYTAKQLVKHLFSEGTKSLVFYDKMLSETSDPKIKKLLVEKLKSVAKELDDLEKLNKELGEMNTYIRSDYEEHPHKRTIVPGMSQAERRLVNKQNAPSTPKPEIRSSGRGREIRSRTSS
ncbi:hypothetical protein C4577_07620 [Candidatus Parcubacteria bacterium]|nr:MAG: hypothetical protein C4577_07620 [Candidatus Parcubacteria bacterium]